MKKKSPLFDDLPALRLRAEEHLKEQQKNNPIACTSPDEMLNLIHELSVHQIELEMQLEERSAFQAENPDKAKLAQANERLSANKISHRDLIDYMRNGYVYGRVIYEKGSAIDFVHEEVNSGYETLTGLKNVVGRKISEVFPGIEQSQPEFLEKQFRVAETGIPDHFEFYLEPLSKWFDLSMYSPKKGYFVAMFDDVTERKRYEFFLRFRLRILQMADASSVETLLEETLDETEQLTNSSLGTVYFVTKDQMSLSLQAISTNTAKTIGRCKEKGRQTPLGKAAEWADAVREQKAVIHHYDPPLNSFMGMPKKCHAAVRRELIVPVIRNDRIVAIIGLGNKPGAYDQNDVNWVNILANMTWDIVAKKIAETEQEKLQLQLRLQLQQSEKMEMVGQLAAGMAHEINNPLNFIAINFENIREISFDLQEIIKEYQNITKKIEEGTFTDLDLQRLRQRETELDLKMLIDDIPDILAESQRGLERITTIIDSMRNLSHRYAIDKMILFDINQGIIDTLAITRHEYLSCADITTTLEELPLILCNPEQINKVFLNILINSIQAIQSQKRRSNGTISIHTWFDCNNVYCTITDDGPGIPEEIKKDIFNPFFTTKCPGKGTGLGLSISWDIIVTMYKGTLTCDTPAEGGTVFTLSLPRTIEG